MKFSLNEKKKKKKEKLDNAENVENYVLGYISFSNGNGNNAKKIV